MLLTNIPDYLPDTDRLDEFKFHIPDFEDYKGVFFPYHFCSETGVILDSEGRCAIMSYGMLNRHDWEFI